MTQLLISWVCDHCVAEASQPSPGPIPELPVGDLGMPGGHLWIVGGCVNRGYPSGFASLDAITGTNGYPTQVITELFGDSETLDRCWRKLPAGLELDLDLPTDDLTDQLSQMLATYPMVGVRVYGGDGTRYATMANLLDDLVRESSSGVVLFNDSVRTNPLCSVAPRVVKFLAALRIRLMIGRAEVVKSRNCESGSWCKL